MPLIYVVDPGKSNAQSSLHPRTEPFKEVSRYLLHSVRHVFGTTRSAVQGKLISNLYVAVVRNPVRRICPTVEMDLKSVFCFMT
jgi:hypothetical protein